MRVSRPRRAAVNQLGAVLAWSLCLLMPTSGDAEPSIPASDSVVLETLPDARSPELAALASLQAAHTKSPRELEPALALARRALALGQRGADPRLVGRAEAVLTPWLGLAEPPLQVLLLHAPIQPNRH